MSLQENEVSMVQIDGQPTSSYGCNENGHLYQVCPSRRRARRTESAAPPTSWTETMAFGSGRRRNGTEVTEERAGNRNQTDPAGMTLGVPSGSPK